MSAQKEGEKRERPKRAIRSTLHTPKPVALGKEAEHVFAIFACVSCSKACRAAAAAAAGSGPLPTLCPPLSSPCLPLFVLHFV